MSEFQQSERRRYFRLRYPKAERLTVQIDGQDFQVSEISEKGTKVLLPKNYPVSDNQYITGVLWFPDGMNIVIHGVVVRSDNDGIALKLSKGIDKKRMLIEQNRLLEKYPSILDPFEKRIDTNPAG